jgi:hypothetical protein
MLTRDLQGAWVLADIAAWVQDPTARLASGQETAIDGERIKDLCPKG